MSMLQNPHFLFARMGQSPSCRNLIALEENQSLSHFLQAKVTLGSLSLSLSHFLILGFFKDISEFVFFFLFHFLFVWLQTIFVGFFLLHIIHFMVYTDSCRLRTFFVIIIIIFYRKRK